MTGRILACGDRNWIDKSSIDAVISELIRQYGDEIAIIHGNCRGADRLAGEVALERELVTVAVPAKWKKHDKAAGPIRNRYMLDKCRPHLVVAFHPDISRSRGTRHMINIAAEAGIPVMVVASPNDVSLQLPEILERPADGTTPP